ncbi:MAG: hypothetical protein HKL80_10915, partial [Acidimicrobiales bacterium]|nr:hypothetical protein [Acidimicrobiales bacterium]
MRKQRFVTITVFALLLCWVLISTTSSYATNKAKLASSNTHKIQIMTLKSVPTKDIFDATDVGTAIELTAFVTPTTLPQIPLIVSAPPVVKA